MKTKNKQVKTGCAATLLGLIGLFSCVKSDELVTAADADQVYAEDILEIENYFAEIGINDFDTTQTGVRYKILETGEGKSVENANDVTLEYTAYLTNGEILSSSLQAVLDTTELDDLDDPIIFTHTFNGFGLDDLFINRTGGYKTNGFRDAITTILNNSHNNDGLKPKGSAIIGIPSALSYVTVSGASFISVAIGVERVVLCQIILTDVTE